MGLFTDVAFVFSFRTTIHLLGVCRQRGREKAALPEGSTFESLTHLAKIVGFALKPGLNFSICAVPMVIKLMCSAVFSLFNGGHNFASKKLPAKKTDRNESKIHFLKMHFSCQLKIMCSFLNGIVQNNSTSIAAVDIIIAMDPVSCKVVAMDAT